MVRLNENKDKTRDKNASYMVGWDKLGQLPKTTKRERETKMEHAP